MPLGLGKDRAALPNVCLLAKARSPPRLSHVGVVHVFSPEVILILNQVRSGL